MKKFALGIQSDFSCVVPISRYKRTLSNRFLIFERVYFIMQIKKVDSRSVILHEETEVKFKIAGNTREVQFSVGVNKKCPIQNISKDKYLDKETGEIKERKKSENRNQSPKSVRKSINKLMDLIRCNATEKSYCK